MRSIGILLIAVLSAGGAYADPFPADRRANAMEAARHRAETVDLARSSGMRRPERGADCPAGSKASPDKTTCQPCKAGEACPAAEAKPKPKPN
jgi:hypothetical protein